MGPAARDWTLLTPRHVSRSRCCEQPYAIQFRFSPYSLFANYHACNASNPKSNQPPKCEALSMWLTNTITWLQTEATWRLVVPTNHTANHRHSAHYELLENQIRTKYFNCVTFTAHAAHNSLLAPKPTPYTGQPDSHHTKRACTTHSLCIDQGGS